MRTPEKIAAGFLTATLIVVVGGVSALAIGRYRGHEAWVGHTLLVRARIDHLRARIEEAETSERGYLLTADTAYLSAFRGARLASGEELAYLRRLTADNATQQARLDSIAPRLDRRMDELAATIAVRDRDGLAGAMTTIAERGPAPTNDLRRRIDALHREEDLLLERRTADREASANAALGVVLVGSLVAFVLVASSLRWLQLDARERERTLAQLHATQRVTDATISHLALDRLLEELLRRVREVMGVDAAIVLLRARDGVHLEVCATSGIPELEEEARARLRVPIGQGIAGGIAAEGRGRIVEDIRTAEPTPLRQALAHSVRSLMGVPLLAHGEVIGVLEVATAATRRFTEDELAILALVADRAATAIERGRAYQAERRSEERFRLLVEGVEDHALILLDREGHVASWNVGAERMSGWSAREATGARFALFFPSEEAAAGVPNRLLETARSRGHLSEEGWRVRRDGTRFWADTSLTALHDDDGAPIGWAVITRDLSERRAAEAEREHLLDRERELRREAEKASAAKSQFLATMSHELRTPLNAVLGYTELLDIGVVGAMTPEQRAYLERIAASGRHLLGLIDDVLDFSRVEAGEVAVTLAPARMSRIAHAAASLVRPQAAARQLSVEVRCETNPEPHFLGDEHRVRQILVNLLSNAVKFTQPGGSVTVECGVEHAAAGNGAVELVFARVRDTGVGIEASELRRIFDPFVQLAPLHTRTAGGVGLGLSISRRFAEAMGGSLDVASVPGVGSTFTLRVPLAPKPPGLDAGRRIAVGQMLIASAGEIAAEVADALRGDARTPGARMLSGPELEDHGAALLADVGQTLVILDEDSSPRSQTALLADGSAIRGTISELHGAQRRRLGWSEAEVRREFELICAATTHAVRRGLAASPAAPVDETIQLVLLLLAEAERLSLEGFRGARERV